MKNVFQFDLPAHTTRREWAVYIIITKSDSVKKQFLYVGKVGDNREGCNPIISRIGNHFSHNKIHSQFRNKISAIESNRYQTTDFDYKIFYSTFGIYSTTTNRSDKDRINEIERQLNFLLQEKIQSHSDSLELLNPYRAVGILAGWLK